MNIIENPKINRQWFNLSCLPGKKHDCLPMNSCLPMKSQSKSRKKLSESSFLTARSEDLWRPDAGRPALVVAACSRPKARSQQLLRALLQQRAQPEAGTTESIAETYGNVRIVLIIAVITWDFLLLVGFRVVIEGG